MVSPEEQERRDNMRTSYPNGLRRKEHPQLFPDEELLEAVQEIVARQNDPEARKAAEEDHIKFFGTKM